MELIFIGLSGPLFLGFWLTVALLMNRGNK
jgi:hypothetical protein